MMGRIQLEAAGLEFEENGNTIWVHGPHGTMLRIKCSGQISVKHCEAPGPPATGGARTSARPGRVLSGSGAVQAVGRRAGAVPAAQAVVRGTTRSAVSRRGGRTGGRNR